MTAKLIPRRALTGQNEPVPVDDHHPIGTAIALTRANSGAVSYRAAAATQARRLALLGTSIS